MSFQIRHQFSDIVYYFTEVYFGDIFATIIEYPVVRDSVIIRATIGR